MTIRRHTASNEARVAGLLRWVRLPEPACAMRLIPPVAR
jgi:hypothetical protein